MSEAAKGDEVRKALLLVVTTSETRAWLAGHDPKALHQAEAALQGSPELEEYFKREREKAAEVEPKFCPFCGKTNLHTDLVPDGWPSYSSQDHENTAVLHEHQCADCDGKSFWT